MNDEAKNSHQLDDWEPCEGGELRQVVWRMKAERRNREMVKSGGIVVILLLCAFAATLVWRQSGQDENVYAGISCQEVKPHLSALKQNRIQDQQLVQQLRAHLKECPNCGPLYEEMSDQSGDSQFAWHKDACGCGGCSERGQPPSSDDFLIASGSTQ